MDKHATDDAARVLAGNPSASPDSDTALYPILDPGFPIEDRVANLLSLLTVDETIALLKMGIGVPRLGIPESDNFGTDLASRPIPQFLCKEQDPWMPD